MMWRIGRRMPAVIEYVTTSFLSRVATQLSQRRIVRGLVRGRGVTVVHQPMPVSPREPSLLFGFGVPVIIGPMNGGMDYPPAFGRHRGSLEGALMTLGRASAAVLNALLPGKRRAAALLVANQRTRQALPQGVCRTVIEIVENGVDLGIWKDTGGAIDHPSDDAVTFVFMGRLVDWKAVDLLLHAFAIARHRARMRLWILGDGDQRTRLDALAAELGIAGGAMDGVGTVHFAGWLTQKACAERLARADCLVLPSLLECGGAVVLEAMSMAKPVITTAWGGPLDYLDPSCGILVEPQSREAVIEGFAAAMAALTESPGLRARMGRNAYAKVRREFDWESKVDRILEIYREAVLRHRGDAGGEVQSGT
jgi:glycosyltransferase involved in cell wall biosynthesis